MKRVGKELGAEYLVEGSLRKVGDRIRFTAQLIEASSGTHLWADRYDRELAGIFDIQDEVTQTIVATLKSANWPDEDRTHATQADGTLGRL
jgi:adenylate cyclase